MQKLKLQNKWDDSAKTFSKTEFEVRDSDKVVSGKLSVTSKKNDKFISRAIPFIIFKSKVDHETIDTILSAGREQFEADFVLMVDSFVDKKTNKEVSFLKVVINKARPASGISQHSIDKGNGYQPQAEEVADDEIPW